MNDQTPDIIPPPRPQRPSSIRNLLPRLPERGHIKIGGLGDTRQSKSGRDYQMPVKFNHFRITTLERGADGNFIMDAELHKKLDLSDAPTEIPVRLLYDDQDLNFQTRYACYSGKTLWCSGDGETAQRASLKHGDKPLPETFTVQCPCHRQEPSYAGQDRCKMNGRLSVLIDGAGGVGGIWVFRTTSYNSITGLASSLMLLRAITGGVLANIPLVLRIQPKQATSPTDGKPLTIYIVSLEYAGDISELQQMGHQIALERARTHISIANIEDEARKLLALPLPANAVLPGDDAEVIVDEFYPEQNSEMAGAIVPPRPTRESVQADLADEVVEEALGEGTYPVVTVDGEAEDVPLNNLVARLTEIFIEAAKRGRAAWEGAGESNNIIPVLNEDGYAEIGEAIVQAWYDAEPPKAAPQQQAKKPRPRRSSRPKVDATSTNGSPGLSSTGERDNIWSRESFVVDIPTKPDGTPYWMMLRQRLLFLVEQAESPVELTKFEADNEPVLTKLDGAYHEYVVMVRQAYMAAGKRLAGGEGA